MNLNLNITKTAEHVGAGHPDKACDKISDAVHDAIYDAAVAMGHEPQTCRAAIETFAKSDLVVVSGEYELARQLIQVMDAGRADGTLGYLMRDTKSQVSVLPNGEIGSVIVSAQHTDDVTLDQLREDIFKHVVVPVVGDLPRNVAKINHKGSFVEGGTDADAGLTGRKIVVDAYGPHWPVGGGAFSGKDPSKVDRSGAYMARALARTILEDGFADGQNCLVGLSYGIGQIQPEAVMAVVDGQHDVSDWVKARFGDLSPCAIQDRLGLWMRDCWTYEDTASFGHFGRAGLPWEKSLLK